MCGLGFPARRRDTCSSHPAAGGRGWGSGGRLLLDNLGPLHAYPPVLGPSKEKSSKSPKTRHRL